MQDIDTLVVHVDHFETLALRIAWDLINRRLIPVPLNTPEFDAVVDSIIYSLKHQHQLHQNWTPEMDADASKIRCDIPWVDPDVGRSYDLSED